MAAHEVGARCAPASITGCRATTSRPRRGWRKPSVASTPSAASSTSRKTPVITALTRTFRMEITVTMAVATSATGSAGIRDHHAEIFRQAERRDRLAQRAAEDVLKPSAMKPKDGPSVWLHHQHPAGERKGRGEPGC